MTPIPDLWTKVRRPFSTKCRWRKPPYTEAPKAPPCRARDLKVIHKEPLFWGLNPPKLDFFSNQNKGYTWVSGTYIFIHNPNDNPNKLKDWDFHVFEIINQITKNWKNMHHQVIPKLPSHHRGLENLSEPSGDFLSPAFGMMPKKDALQKVKPWFLWHCRNMNS